MKRFVILAALAGGLAASAQVARAQVATWDYTFVTVDAVSTGAFKLYVTGILEGGANPVEVSLQFSSSAAPIDNLAGCQRSALLAMERPGQYKLQLSRQLSSTGYPYCRLVRVNP